MLILSSLSGLHSMTTAVRLHQLRQFEGRCELALVNRPMRRTIQKMLPVKRRFREQLENLYRINLIYTC